MTEGFAIDRRIVMDIIEKRYYMDTEGKAYYASAYYDRNARYGGFYVVGVENVEVTESFGVIGIRHFGACADYERVRIVIGGSRRSKRRDAEAVGELNALVCGYFEKRGRCAILTPLSELPR